MATLRDFELVLLTDFPQWPLPIIQRELVSAIQEFCEDTWILSSDVHHIFTLEDINTENFNSVTIALPEGLRDSYSPFAINGFKVNNQSVDLVYAQNVNNCDVNDSTRKYFNFNSDNTLFIFPFVSPGSIWIKLIYKPLRSSMEFDDKIYEHYLDAITANVRYRMYDMVGKPWYNAVAASIEIKKYRAETSKAKKRMTVDYQKKSKAIKWREFGG